MESSIEFSITLNFKEFHELSQFFTDMQYLQEQKEKKSQKKETDLRGKHTKEMHRKTRQFHIECPEMTYHECMSNLKNLDILNKE
jgi:hypothetical protein